VEGLLMSEEFEEELYRENLYFVYEDKCRELEKELDKFRPFTSAYEMKKEIERLNKQIEEYQKALDETTSKKIDLENIIKEVRNILEPLIALEGTMTAKGMNKLLEILDKVDKGE
jgi:chromosome segregation ATPase